MTQITTGIGAESLAPADALHAWRVHAAHASGGTSSPPILDHVLALLSTHQPRGSLLDFGAGTGDLVRRLLGEQRYARIAAADLYPRPDWLPAHVPWWQHDLNEPFASDERFDAVVCSEVIEHLENPRQVFRTLRALVAPGGLLVLTMPNNECLRALGGLLLRGHFTSFLPSSYPQHITALLRMDLERLCLEAGFEPPTFSFPDDGAVPKLPSLKWRQVSGGLLRGRLFSDSIAMHARRRA